jgi:hypothetical protein
VEAEETVKSMINAMNWWKKKGTEYDAIEESLGAVAAMMRHKLAKPTLSSEILECLNTNSRPYLSAREANKTAEELEDTMGWWQWKGKDIEVDSAFEDEASFKMAQCLGHIWQNTNSSKGRE